MKPRYRAAWVSLVIGVTWLVVSCHDGPRGDEPDGVGSGSHRSPEHVVPRALSALENDLNSALTPQLAVDWRHALLLSRGVRATWLTPHEVVVEDARRIVNGIDRATGRTGFLFQLDYRNDAPDRALAWPPARSESYLHLVCNDRLLFTIDRFGNLEHTSTLDAAPTSPPAGTDRYVLAGTPSNALCAWDVVRGQSAKQVECGSPVSSQPLIHGDRVYVVTDAGRVSALSLDPARLLEPLWVRAEPRPPNAVAPGAVRMAIDARAEQLYVVSRTPNAVDCLALRDGAVRWSQALSAAITGELMVGAQHGTDRLYAVVQNAHGSSVQCVSTGARSERAAGRVQWTFVGANLILALGPHHLYVRTGQPGTYRIAILQVSNGTPISDAPVDPRLDIWLANPHAHQLIVGSNYLDEDSGGRVGLYFSATPHREALR